MVYEFKAENAFFCFFFLVLGRRVGLFHYNKMFKIIVIGNSAVGKTSIVNRFVGDRFDHNYRATIAADFQVKILNIADQ